MHPETNSFRLACDGPTATITLNTLPRWGRAWLTELQNLTSFLAQQPQLETVIFKGGTGAWNPEYDQREVLNFKNENEALTYAAYGQEVMETLRRLSEQIPVVASLDGPCSLVGLELAMACSHRVMVANPDSKIAGLNLGSGTFPAWGLLSRVMQRTTRSRCETWTSGESLRPRDAQKIALLDRVCASGRLEIEVRSFCDELIRKKSNSPQRVSSGVAFVEWLKKVTHTGRTNETQSELAETWSTELKRLQELAHKDLALGLVREKQLFATYSQLPEYRRASEVQHKQRETPRIYPEPINPLPPIPHKIGIVGGGEVGTFLAIHLAERGCEIAIHEATSATAETTTRRIEKSIQNRIAQRVCTPIEGDKLRRGISLSTQWNGFENVDCVIESAEEDLGVKRNLLAKLEELVRPRVVIASTSTNLLIESLQNEMKRPNRVAGFHLVETSANLVELVRGIQTDSGTMAAIARWGHYWGFQVAQVADRVGRLAMRVRMAYLSEGVHLVAEGLDPRAIDEQARRFGFRRGPLEWCDELGFDSLSLIAEQYQLAQGDYAFARNLLFERFLPFGFFGKQNGEGFYRYRGDRKRYNEIARMLAWNDLDEGSKPRYVHSVDQANTEGFQRLLLRVVNEAAHGLSDEPEASPLTVDAILCSAIGFPIFRGGPLRYADDLGIAGVVDRLATYAERHGPRLNPCEDLVRRAEAGEGFYTPMTNEEYIVKSRAA